MRPRFSDGILNGTKTVELRRTRPQVEAGDPVLIYATSPVKAIVGGFLVEDLLQSDPAELWAKVKGLAGVTEPEYEAYFSGTRTACVIRVTDPWRLRRPVYLEALQAHRPSFRPPRSYGYLPLDDGLAALLIGMAAPPRAFGPTRRPRGLACR